MADFKSLTIDSGIIFEISDTDNIVTGAGLKSAAGNLTITPAGSSLVVAANKGFIVNAGTSLFDFSAGSGVFKTTTGTVTIGPGTTVLSGQSTFSAAGTALTVTNNTLLSGLLAVSGVSTFSSLINANGSIDRSTVATLSIGATNTTTLNLGRTGQLVQVVGDLAVAGTETVTGTTIFQNSATFDGNVQFGDAVTDTITFTSRTATDLHFLKEINHTIDIDPSTTVSTAGANLTIRSGVGSLASVALVGGTGGQLTVQAGTGGAAFTGVGSAGTGGLQSLVGGTGGAGTATGLAGVGGALQLTAGQAGANGGAGGANGGSVSLDSGAGSGAGVGGTVTLGTTNSSLLTIGRPTIITHINTALLKINTVPYSWPGSQGGASTVLSNDGSGGLTWASVATGNVSGSAATGQVAFWTGANSIAGENAFFWNTGTKRLGIGTNTPDALIEASTSTESVPLHLLQTGTGQNNIQIQRSGGTASNWFVYLPIGSTDLRLNSAGDKVTFEASGNVGIGTTTPASTLDVNGSAQMTGFKLTTGAGNGFVLTSDAMGVGTWQAGGGSSSDLTQTGLTTAALTAGLSGYLISNATVAKTDSTALATSRFFGVFDGTAGSIVSQGNVTAAFTTVGGSPGAGQPVYLAAAADEGSAVGKLTATVPTTGVVAQVGLCVDNTNYAGAKTAIIAIQVMPPVTL